LVSTFCEHKRVFFKWAPLLSVDRLITGRVTIRFHAAVTGPKSLLLSHHHHLITPLAYIDFSSKKHIHNFSLQTLFRKEPTVARMTGRPSVFTSQVCRRLLRFPSLYHSLTHGHEFLISRSLIDVRAPHRHRSRNFICIFHFNCSLKGSSCSYQVVCVPRLLIINRIIFQVRTNPWSNPLHRHVLTYRITDHIWKASVN
jgi:hypothetical protein